MDWNVKILLIIIVYCLLSAIYWPNKKVREREREREREIEAR